MSEIRAGSEAGRALRDWSQWAANVQGKASPIQACMTMLMLAETAAIICSAVVAKIIYIDFFLQQSQSILPYLALTPLLAFTLSMFYRSLELDEFDALTKPTVGFGKVWGGLALSFMVVLGILYLFKSAEFYSRGWFLSWFVLSAFAVVGIRILMMRRVEKLSAAGHLRQRIALYGTPQYLEQIKEHIQSACSVNRVDGVYVSDAGGENPQRELEELQQAMAWGAYDKIVIGMPPSDTQGMRDAVRSLGSYSSEILLCTDLQPFPLAIHGSRTIGRLRAKIVSQFPASEKNRLSRRLLDYGVAAIGLIILAPLLALIALAIKLESPGPVFFRQRRYGQNNGVFKIFKFRTMTVTEDGTHVKQAEKNDARVTRIGRLLRASSLDEVPQLLNVLKGEMSIVGPRPHALAHDHWFEQQLDLFSSRRQVLPGLTGWAQVNGYRGETKTEEDIRKRMQYDLYYIDNWSIWFDIEIMVRTLVTVMRGAH